MENNSFFRRI